MDSNQPSNQPSSYSMLKYVLYILYQYILHTLCAACRSCMNRYISLGRGQGQVLDGCYSRTINSCDIQDCTDIDQRHRPKQKQRARPADRQIYHYCGLSWQPERNNAIHLVRGRPIKKCRDRDTRTHQTMLGVILRASVQVNKVPA